MQRKHLDGSELDRWLTSTDPKDACAAVSCGEPNHIDRIFFRSGVASVVGPGLGE